MHPADQGKSGAVAEGVTLAANDDRAPDGSPARAVDEAPKAGPAGWDPFEVWRTRVRDPRRVAPAPAED